MDWRKWKHITKLDPDKKILFKDISKLVDAGTDALMLSGTQNITFVKMQKLFNLVKNYDIPKIIEPSAPEHIISEADYIFVPSVINSKTTEWLIGKHIHWIEKLEIDWKKILPEAYIVLNSNSAVAKVTNAITELTTKQICAYAVCAEKYFSFPIIYLEYSGMYGKVNVVKSVSKALKKSMLYYGGGIDCKEKALKMKKYANTIIVGNIIYEDIEKALNTIIKMI